jgi:hypothetical protein
MFTITIGVMAIGITGGMEIIGVGIAGMVQVGDLVGIIGMVQVGDLFGITGMEILGMETLGVEIIITIIIMVVEEVIHTLTIQMEIDTVLGMVQDLQIIMQMGEITLI